MMTIVGQKFYLLFFLLASTMLGAQEPVSLKNMEIGFPERRPAGLDEIALPFTHIRIVDARFDTSRVGVQFHGLAYKNITTETGNLLPIEQHLNRNYIRSSDGKNGELILVIRYLWIHEIRAGEKEIEGFSSETKRITECIARLETYIRKDKYYQALTRMDTVFENSSTLRGNEAETLLQSFHIFLKKLNEADLSHLLSFRKKITEEEFNAHFKQRFQIPRLNNDTLVRGIYLTYNDFIHNKPINYNFHFEEDKEADYLYIDENGSSRLLTEYWGFCDGENHFMRIGMNVFQLYRYNNTFTLMGCRQAIRIRKAPPPAQKMAALVFIGFTSHNRKIKFGNKLRPMLLDMETGKAY